ncbi:MAG: FAD-binding oxidoreductase [Actinomycetota bacterium]|nr:FAD-binding oxidoreductase [Actinomycetota bacterium]MDQ6944816.1 FAD-binding oxidoreductase [Actinomycetota bacterium]
MPTSSDTAVTLGAGLDMRPGGDADRIDGVEAGAVVTARDADDVAAVLSAAGDARATVVVRGAATKLDWGSPPRRADLVVDVSGLDNVLDHAAGDLVVRVQPGVRLADLQAVLASSGQRLAVDEVVAGSTVGGIIATSLAGPLRLAHGAVRDLLLGITVVVAGGRSATSGGRVVKNVAGYDLAKLYAGSYGTLGVVTEAFLRLHPIPERSAWLTVATPDASSVERAVAALGAARITPAALEVHDGGDGPAEVVALLDGTESGLKGRLDAARELVGTGFGTSFESPAWWATMPGLAPGETLLKATTTITQVGSLIAGLRRCAAEVGASVEINGSAGVGVLYAGIGAGAPSGTVHRILATARRLCGAVGGSAVVLRAPAHERAGMDAWGPVPALALMRSVKDGFDPHHLLAPGRFVGGI